MQRPGYACFLLAVLLIAVTSQAQYKGFDIPGLLGLQSGTQAPPGLYVGNVLLDFATYGRMLLALPLYPRRLSLALWIPRLLRVRKLGLRDYSKLGNRYTDSFDRKWVHCAEPPSEPLLGTADIQSLADLGGSFERVQQMSVAPISKGLVIQFAVLAGLPLLPVAIYVTPTSELVKAILKMVA